MPDLTRRRSGARRRLYSDALRWPIEGNGNGHPAFKLQSGSYLFFILRTGFASFTELAQVGTAVKGASECILSYFATGKKEVDDILRRAGSSGVPVTAAKDRLWGYAGYFGDPHGHLGEITWNPAIAPPQER